MPKLYLFEIKHLWQVKISTKNNFNIDSKVTQVKHRQTISENNELMDIPFGETLHEIDKLGNFEEVHLLY